MTREEFDSILEEAFIEGYDAAQKDLEEVLNKELEEYEVEEPVDESIEIEDDYDDYYDEAIDVRKRMNKILNNVPGKSAINGLTGKVSKTGSNFKKQLKSFKARVLKTPKNASKVYDKNKQLIKNKFNRLLAKRSI